MEKFLKGGLLCACLASKAVAVEVTLESAISLPNEADVSVDSLVSADATLSQIATLNLQSEGPLNNLKYRYSLGFIGAANTPLTEVTNCSSNTGYAQHIELSGDGKDLLVLLRSNKTEAQISRVFVLDTENISGFCPPHSPSLNQAGWTQLLDWPAIGPLSGSFSADGNWLVIGVPGASPSNPPQADEAGITQGLVKVFRKTGTSWRQLSNTVIDAPVLGHSGGEPLNGEAGTAVAISNDGSTIAVTHPARRPPAGSSALGDIVGGVIPYPSGTRHPSGIFIGDKSQSTLTWTFFELPSLLSGSNPLVGANPFTGHPVINTNLRISADGEFVYVLQNEYEDNNAISPTLYIYTNNSGTWTLSHTVKVGVDGQSPGRQCFEGGAPTWFTSGKAIASDFIVSQDNAKIALALVPESSIQNQPDSALCLFQKTGVNRWRAVAGSADRSAAALGSSPPFADSRREQSWTIKRLQGDPNLSRVLLPSYSGAKTLGIDWNDEATPPGIPVWLLYEASKSPN